MNIKDFLLRTLELSSWQCHNRQNKIIVNDVKRDINRLFVEHEKLNLSIFHSAPVIASILETAIQHASYDNRAAGKILRDASQFFLEKTVFTFAENPEILLHRDLEGNTPLDIAVTYKNEGVLKALLHFLTPFQLVELLTYFHAKSGKYSTLLDKMLQSEWNFGIKSMNAKLSSDAFSVMMEKLNRRAHYPDAFLATKVPTLTYAAKILSRRSTQDFVSFVTRMITHSHFSVIDPQNIILNPVSLNQSNLLHHLLKDPRFMPLAENFIDALKIPVSYLQRLMLGKDENGQTPLHTALIHGYFKMASKILPLANPQILSIRDAQGKDIFDLLKDYTLEDFPLSASNESSLIRILDLLDRWSLQPPLSKQLQAKDRGSQGSFFRNNTASRFPGEHRKVRSFSFSGYTVNKSAPNFTSHTLSRNLKFRTLSLPT